MVGMVSCVVLVLMGQAGTTTRKPRCSFFPELDPIKFPYVHGLTLENSTGRVAGAANIGADP